MYAGLSPVDPLPGSSRARPPREIFVSVQLHLSKAAAAQRKLTRRKTDKRESLRPATASAADINQKRIKEKSSWLNLAKLNGSAEQWRPATCKLSEEESGCSLNVYIEDSILYQTVHVHKLYHTDVRRIHHSLFERKDCLGIYCIDGQAWSPTGSIEPIFLCFPETDLMNTWMALLRSYAIPEVYGRWHSIPDGGLYRMWRQVKLTCLQGRNLGTHRPVPEDPQNSDYDNRQDGDAIDIDVYCEIYVNGYLSGRTTVKKGIGSPDWHESFTFEDLPPFDSLEIVIMREKKLTKPVIVGSVFIYLMNFRRGEFVEGWFPVLAGGGHVDIQAGEMRLKIKVDEEIILPSATYARLVRTLQSRNYLDWLQDFEARLHLKSLSEPIMAVALSRNVLLDNILELADREVDGTPSSHMTLFRGNTVFTKTAERFMALYGASFLEASVGTVIRRLCADKVSIEIDPVRSGRSQRSIGRNVDELVHWCQEFWTSIYDARTQCPMEMRKLFTHIRMLIESRYRPKDDERYRELPWQGVSSFLFLRFLVPAVLNPHLFGILPGLPEEPIARSLKLIAKVLQNLANMNTTVQKEGFMKAVEDFLGRSSDAMVDYILMLSSVEGTPSCPPGKDGREKVRAVRLLQHRTANSPILFREAIPSLPYVLDVPKHLAVVCSVVVRHSRKHGYPVKPNDANDVQFNELCLRCLEVEEQALQRVSQLARRIRPPQGTPMSPISPGTPSVPPMPPSPSSSSPHAVSPRPRDRKISLPGKRRRTRSSNARPSTAPSQTDSDDRSPNDQTDASLPSSPISGGNLSRIFSRTSISSRQSLPIPSPVEDMPSPNRDGEPRSLPTGPPRPPLQHHPRSTSTDSALGRKNIPTPLSPTITSTVVAGNAEPMSPGAADDPTKKRKGILRLVRR